VTLKAGQEVENRLRAEGIPKQTVGRHETHRLCRCTRPHAAPGWKRGLQEEVEGRIRMAAHLIEDSLSRLLRQPVEAGLPPVRIQARRHRLLVHHPT
jgi:hypothetical protein